MKKTLKLTGTDGNIFAVAGLTKKTLKEAGRVDLANQVVEKVFSAQSYFEALDYCASLLEEAGITVR